MRARLIAAFAAIMMFLALGVSVGPAPTAQAVFYTKTFNHCGSAHRVQVANGLSGLGTREYVNPCRYSVRGTNSIYVSYTCATSAWKTSISGTTFTSRGWKNVGHYAFDKRVYISPCNLYIR